MSRYTFQKSIAAALGVAVVGAGLLASISSNAQSGTTTTPGTTTPGTTPTPTPTSTPTPTASPTASPTPAGGSMSEPGMTTTPATKPAGKTIVNIASGNKNFSTLVTALKAADLVDTLSGTGPYTVFAPTNAAFAKLPKATLANLLKPANKAQLQKVLTYHVVSGNVTSKMLKAGPVATVQGSNVNVKLQGKKVTVNNATVILADVKASNGVIHAIDTVLLPK
ncbi:fasciclin domain-containing protein [Chamaesiphon minutus]|uniref:Secreted/surface protein with fasciclin-like repeats n=1 Tax=Chamaesiphon minutus (strain ATCC 27169 / PCC 6605) TaxID=1173020 RepID=K9UI39_CHAP6|nr:fasciclin domain-containing protein [Chamaesiphon minutus]AFY94485.1 secreted/surface protein with fasciclin-like repeats [Chamaesiphon minutus PCC 6605]